MSRQRTRPTRETTRQQLFQAAAQVFEEHGIGASSIEAITAAAGLTRGAFYSNFAGKDELIVAMLQDHVDRSLGFYRELLAQHADRADFMAALKVAERTRRDLLGRAPLLHMELILFVARSAKRRPELAKRLRARRSLITEIITITNQAGGWQDRFDPVWAGAMLLALEDGFRLHRLIDPDTTPADSFVQAVGELWRVIGESHRSHT
jgi:AcrR family transcriptional regulator